MFSNDGEGLRDTYCPPGSTSGSSPTSQQELFRSVPKPKFPIRITEKGPTPFSVEAQKRWIRWTHSWDSAPQPYWIDMPILKLIKDIVSPVLEKLGDTETDHLDEYIFRIPLPIDPYYKIESDVGTTELVRYFTGIPVPTIYTYNSSSDNPLGLEWILMEKVIGTPIREEGLDIDNETHKLVTEQIAGSQNQLAKLHANQIGGIYLRWTDDAMEFLIGQISDPIYELTEDDLQCLDGNLEQCLTEPTEEETIDVGVELVKEVDVVPLSLEELQDKKDTQNRKEYDPQSNWNDAFRTYLTHPDLSGNNLMTDTHGNPPDSSTRSSQIFLPVILQTAYPPLLQFEDIDEDFDEDFNGSGPGDRDWAGDPESENGWRKYTTISSGLISARSTDGVWKPWSLRFWLASIKLMTVLRSN
ncbi:MAG: hypothetical protein Q9187_004220 [Circinaria calcarea]